ncbi:MAG TPA: hypothetical protein VGR70_08720 [Stellaceae bacterium]|nr:hypothetical protein [Stellaceae bacterium]
MDDEDLEKVLVGCKAIGEDVTNLKGKQAERWAQNLIDRGDLRSAFKFNNRWCARRGKLRQEIAEIERKGQAARAA